MGSPTIRVVSAVVAREGRYLITQRRPSAVLGGLWEFPGGKVEPGETDAAALVRELRERLGIEVLVQERIGLRVHQYDGYSVELNLYQCDLSPDAVPRAARVAAFRWVPSEEFDQYQFPAADQATMDLLLGIKRY